MQKENLKFINRNCKVHGETEFVREGSGYYRCKKCRVVNVAKRRHMVRLMLIEACGGKCEICSYNKYSGALSFHHKDPTQKEFGLSERGIALAFNRMLVEAKKCHLLCQNCHQETHGGLHPEYII